MSNSGASELRKLVGRCRQGDKQAWVELIDLITPLIFSICSTMKLSRDESFDIFGQVAYLLLTRLDRIRSPERLLSYVGTTTRREVYALLRKTRFIDYLAEQEALNRPSQDETTPEVLYELTRRTELFMQSLLKLPWREYQLLRLLFLDGGNPSYKEISKKLGMPVSSIGPTRTRSLARLKKLLEEKSFEF
ncbi:MAG: sigma-70 family RNA polymerase sigma factor [Candidatus Zixiibacteriota bacterium]